MPAACRAWPPICLCAVGDAPTQTQCAASKVNDCAQNPLMSLAGGLSPGERDGSTAADSTGSGSAAASGGAAAAGPGERGLIAAGDAGLDSCGSLPTSTAGAGQPMPSTAETIPVAQQSRSHEKFCNSSGVGSRVSCAIAITTFSSRAGETPVVIRHDRTLRLQPGGKS